MFKMSRAVAITAPRGMASEFPLPEIACKIAKQITGNLAAGQERAPMPHGILMVAQAEAGLQ